MAASKAASKAKELIKKMATDKAFRQSVERASSKEERRKILAQHGFGDVSLSDVRAVARAEDAQFSDEQLLAVAGQLGIERPVEWAKVIVSAAALLA